MEKEDLDKEMKRFIQLEENVEVLLQSITFRSVRELF
jgi:hypothetical protein